jgi:hypothetical protein
MLTSESRSSFASVMCFIVTMAGKYATYFYLPTAHAKAGVMKLNSLKISSTPP